MTERAMRRLEGAIGRTLPPTVRGFFLNFPPALRDTEGDPDDFRLTDDADALIEMNTPGGHIYQPPDWTPDMFLLGAGACGETFWVDLGGERGSVHRFDAGEEAGASAELGDSLTEFARGLLEPEAESEPIGRRQAIELATRFARASAPEPGVRVVQVFLLGDRWCVSLAAGAPGGWCETVQVNARTGEARWYQT
jgi:hypothetical protein